MLESDPMSWLRVGERNVTSKDSESYDTVRGTGGWGDRRGEAPPAPPGRSNVRWGQHLLMTPKS